MLDDAIIADIGAAGRPERAKNQRAANPKIDGARRERSGLQQLKADRTLEVREEWRAPAEDYRMDDERVLVDECLDRARLVVEPREKLVVDDRPVERVIRRLDIAVERDVHQEDDLAHGGIVRR